MSEAVAEMTNELAESPVVTQRTTAPAIRRARLRNLQSWSHDTEWLEFLPTGLSVFRARSETGKSVMFKAFLIACFPNFHGRGSRRGLIRWGCDEGSVELELTNGVRVSFIFRLTKTIYKMWDGPEDTVGRTWETTRIPVEITDALHWYVDYETQTLLNLIGGTPMHIFVDSPARYNADALRCITEHPQMVEANNTVAEWMDDLKKAQASLDPIVTATTSVLSQLKATDLHTMLFRVTKAQEILKSWEAAETERKQIEYLMALVNSKPQEATGDIEGAKEVFDSVQALRKTIQAVRAVEVLVAQKPQEAKQVIDTVHGNAIVEALGVLRGCKTAFAGVVHTIKARPAETGDVSVATPIYETLRKARQCQAAYKAMVMEVQTGAKQKKQLSAVRARTEELAKQVGVCPVCGSRLCEHGTD